MLKRGYIVKEYDEEWCVAVVATSVAHAKKIGAGELSCDWIDIRVRWERECDVSDLPIGIIEDDVLALRRGLYGWCDETPCDICGEDKRVEYIGVKGYMNGVIACGNCIDAGLLEYHICAVYGCMGATTESGAPAQHPTALR